MRQRKAPRTVAVIAVILVIAMLVTGTFAWQSIGQMALNQAVVIPGPAGGRLHDDFEYLGENFGQREWYGGRTANKDVYIENFERGEQARDIFVRVRMYEFMEIGPGAMLTPSDSDFADRNAQSLIPGADRLDFTTWTPRVPGHVDSARFEHYWTWNFGGAGDCDGYKWYIPTFNRDPYSLESDVKGAAVDPQGALGLNEVSNTTRRDTDPIGSSPFPLGAGGANFWNEGDYHEAQVKYWCTLTEAHQITPSPERHYAEQTLVATRPPMRMAEWLASGYPSGNFWVLDDDGWFYWAAPLQPGTATGLLLSSITLNEHRPEGMYYGIFIDAQMATSHSWYRTTPGGGFYDVPSRAPSINATQLLSRISGQETTAPFGVWLWRSSQEERMRSLAFAAEQGVTEIYLANRLTDLNLNEANLRAFIAAATELNIAVFNLTGDWSWPSNPNRLVAHLDAFERFQARACDYTRFAGMHLNVEPHQSANPNWSDNPADRAAQLQAYIDMKVYVTDRFGPMDWSVPFWWRSTEDWHFVNHRGVERPLYEASILEANRIVVMSYHRTGAGMYSRGAHWVDFAREQDRPLFLSALIHSRSDAGTGIYFYYLGHDVMMAEIAILRELANIPRLGIAIHEVYGWYELYHRP